MLLINVDALSLIKLFEAEIDLLNRFKLDESKLYTDKSNESENEETTNDDEIDEKQFQNKQKVMTQV